jgi:hypothetical protein
MEQSNRGSPDEKRVGASLAFSFPRLKLGKLFPVAEAAKPRPRDSNPARW